MSFDFALPSETLAQLLRGAFVVMLCGALEAKLNFLCDIGYADRGLQLEYKDIAGKGVWRALLYLEKVLGVKIPTEARSYPEIKTLISVRNIIVHSDGIDSKNLLVNYVRDHPDRGRLRFYSVGGQILPRRYVGGNRLFQGATKNCATARS